MNKFLVQRQADTQDWDNRANRAHVLSFVFVVTVTMKLGCVPLHQQAERVAKESILEYFFKDNIYILNIP